MSGKITEIAGRQIITRTKGDITMYAQNIEFQAGEKVVWTGKENGIFFGDSPKEPPPAVDTEVLEIRLNTPLDQGYNYENGTVRDGMMHDKVYEFEAVRFKDGLVPADRDIRWSYRYDGEQGVVEEEFGLIGRGQKIRIHLSNLDLCGRGVTIRAYIQNNRGSGFLNLWVHYRFRWFKRDQIKEEITDRIGTGLDKERLPQGPHQIDQGSTSLCGMASIFYQLAKDNRAGYQKLALELHQKGETTYNQYTIRPGSASMYDQKPEASDKYPVGIPNIDWIVMASTRSQESTAVELAYVGHAGQDLAAVNWPAILERLSSQLLGKAEVEDKTSFFMNPNTGDKLEWLVAMQKDFQEGYNIFVLIDSDMLKDRPTYLINPDRWHWVNYEGGLFVDENQGTYNFTYWCWGQLPKHRAFRKSNFNSNFYGYIKVR